MTSCKLNDDVLRCIIDCCDPRESIEFYNTKRFRNDVTRSIMRHFGNAFKHGTMYKIYGRGTFLNDELVYDPFSLQLLVYVDLFLRSGTINVNDIHNLLNPSDVSCLSSGLCVNKSCNISHRLTTVMLSFFINAVMSENRRCIVMLLRDILHGDAQLINILFRYVMHTRCLSLYGIPKDEFKVNNTLQCMSSGFDHVQYDIDRSIHTKFLVDGARTSRGFSLTEAITRQVRVCIKSIIPYMNIDIVSDEYTVRCFGGHRIINMLHSYNKQLLIECINKLDVVTTYGIDISRREWSNLMLLLIEHYKDHLNLYQVVRSVASHTSNSNLSDDAKALVLHFIRNFIRLMNRPHIIQVNEPIYPIYQCIHMLSTGYNVRDSVVKVMPARMFQSFEFMFTIIKLTTDVNDLPNVLNSYGRPMNWNDICCLAMCIHKGLLRNGVDILTHLLSSHRIVPSALFVYVILYIYQDYTSRNDAHNSNTWINIINIVQQNKSVISMDNTIVDDFNICRTYAPWSISVGPTLRNDIIQLIRLWLTEDSRQLI